MKKILSALSTFSFLMATSPVFAAIDVGVESPEGIVPANTPIGAIVTFLVGFIIVLAILVAVFFIVIGALQWITSGGDKQKVADARNHIIAAIVGLIIVALTFVIINVVTEALGLGPITGLKILTLPEIAGQ